MVINYVHSVYVFRSIVFVLVDMIHYPLTKHRVKNLEKVKNNIKTILRHQSLTDFLFARVRELELAEKYSELEKKLRELTEKDGKLV